MKKGFIQNMDNTVVEKHICTACMACKNVCPIDAIEIKEDDEHFIYPYVDKTKCTNCGLCKKVCPALKVRQTQVLRECNSKKPVAYGGYIDDEHIRENSSSGGVFTILSKYILDKKGYVCGASHIQGAKVEHIIINSENDLDKIRGSKYVQSNINNCYKKIKQLLEKNNWVLFTGTPCQVAGLYEVLGKDYEKLVTADLLCHGTPSQWLLGEYIKEYTHENLDDIIDMQCRVKKDGWRNFYVKFVTKTKEYIKKFNDSIYFKSFDKNLILRKSCHDCRFNRLPRQGDFTIGDFWGIEKYDKSLDDNRGTSAILINNKKAKNIIKDIKRDFKKLKKVKLKAIQKYNMVDWKSYNHAYRDYFFDCIANKNYTSVSDLMNDCLDKKDGIACLNYSYSKDNYGSVLTAFALQQAIKKRGYAVSNIIFWDAEKITDISNLENFTKKNITELAPCWTEKVLYDTNKYFSTFIVGPDAVWRDLGFMKNFYNNFLNFVDFSKNICSYAASFACKNITNLSKETTEPIVPTEKDIKERKRLLKRFSKIGIREDNGVDLCNEIFNVKATQVLDAVFLLNPNDWREKYASYSSLEKVNVVSYILNWADLDANLLNYINNLEGLSKLYKGETYQNLFVSKSFAYKGVTVEQWLHNIANAELLITDSFHGTCFALIFNVPFIAFEFKESCRIASLLRIVGLEDRILNEKSTIADYKKIENTPIDWDTVNKKLSDEINKSNKFLDEILALNNVDNEARNYASGLELLQNELLKKTKLNVLSDKTEYYICGVPLLKKQIFDNGDKIKYYICNIPWIKKQFANDRCKIKYCFCNIPLFVKKIQNNGKKIKYYILGIPLFKIKSR